jgi:hypothetical protein
LASKEVQIGTTEAIFRTVNERIAESAQRFDSTGAEFVCECADKTCTHRVEATLEEYESVRADATHFLLAPGHDNARVERVLKRKRRYWVVEKFERTVAATVRRLNPRASAL